MSDHAQQEQPQVQQEQQQESSQSPLFKIGDREYDVEAAKTKIEHADKHVQTIESDNATLRQEVEQLRAQVASSSKLDQVLETLQANQVASPTSTDENTTQSVDKEALLNELLSQVAPKIEETLSAKQKQEQLEKTLTETVSLAQAKYGSEYESILRSKGQELGLDDAGIQNMASTQPKVFKQLFGLEQTKVTPSGSPAPSYVTSGNQSSPSQEAQKRDLALNRLTTGFKGSDRVEALNELRKMYAQRNQ